MNPDGYPNLSFKLNDGRTIRVHAFIWEPSLPETMKDVTRDDIKQVEIDRNRFKCSDVIRPTKTHVLDWDRLNKLPSNSSKFPDSTINVLLSSEPLAAGALYSELAVIMFMDHIEELSMQAILEKLLHDLDWAKHAEDVTVAQNELWQDDWLEKTLH